MVQKKCFLLSVLWSEPYEIYLMINKILMKTLPYLQFVFILFYIIVGNTHQSKSIQVMTLATNNLCPPIYFINLNIYEWRWNCKKDNLLFFIYQQVMMVRAIRVVFLLLKSYFMCCWACLCTALRGSGEMSNKCRVCFKGQKDACSNDGILEWMTKQL